MTSLTPNLMTESIEASIDFYCDRLGFSFVTGVAFDSESLVTKPDGEPPLQWAMIQRNGVNLMFQARPSFAEEYPRLAQAEIGISGSLYLEVEDLDQLLAQLDGRAEVAMPERVTFYGMREIWIRDNNGYLLVLAEKANGQD
jgi:uncharacterized glyoxalase superfamily protein PhnB